MDPAAPAALQIARSISREDMAKLPIRRYEGRVCLVATPEDLARQTDRLCALVGKARRNMATMDLVVFPEYALHGLSMDINPAIMCRLDGPEVERFRGACIANDIWGCFSIMELNPHGNPFNSGLIIDNKGGGNGLVICCHEVEIE